MSPEARLHERSEALLNSQGECTRLTQVIQDMDGKFQRLSSLKDKKDVTIDRMGDTLRSAITETSDLRQTLEKSEEAKKFRLRKRDQMRTVLEDAVAKTDFHSVERRLDESTRGLEIPKKDYAVANKQLVELDDDMRQVRVAI